MLRFIIVETPDGVSARVPVLDLGATVTVNGPPGPPAPVQYIQLILSADTADVFPLHVGRTATVAGVLSHARDEHQLDVLMTAQTIQLTPKDR